MSSQGMIFVVRRLQAVGMRSTVAKNHGRMVTQPAADFLVGGSNPCRSTVMGGAAAMFARLGFEPATK